jgi:glutathione S-transferase
MQQSKEWIQRQLKKIELGVNAMANDLGDKSWCNGEGYTLADIGTGCALGYLDLRYADFDWRQQYPNLSRYYDKLSQRPSFQDTRPPPQ